MMSGWCNSHNGKKFFPLDIKPGDVTLDDIAHGLAGRMRYVCQTWLSVAQHSIVVLAVVERLMKLTKNEARYVLFHDGSESVLPDMPAPIKDDERFAWYREVEDRAQAAIYETVGCDVTQVSERCMAMCAIADKIVITAEKRFFRKLHPDWKDTHDLPKEIKPLLLTAYMSEWAPLVAKRKFLEAAARVMGE